MANSSSYLEIPVIRGIVLGVTVYRGHAKLSDLARISSADIYDQINNPMGTQRDLSIKHAKDAYEYVKNRENNWAKSGKSLQDQLKELNDFAKSEIEWEIVKKRIIPKSLKLVKLVKSNFEKGLKFVQIEQLITDKIQVKSFNVEYKDGKQP